MTERLRCCLDNCRRCSFQTCAQDMLRRAEISLKITFLHNGSRRKETDGKLGGITMRTLSNTEKITRLSLVRCTRSSCSLEVAITRDEVEWRVCCMRHEVVGWMPLTLGLKPPSWEADSAGNIPVAINHAPPPLPSSRCPAAHSTTPSTTLPIRTPIFLVYGAPYS
jgi:hypothetical protein